MQFSCVIFRLQVDERPFRWSILSLVARCSKLWVQVSPLAVRRFLVSGALGKITGGRTTVWSTVSARPRGSEESEFNSDFSHFKRKLAPWVGLKPWEVCHSYERCSADPVVFFWGQQSRARIAIPVASSARWNSQHRRMKICWSRLRTTPAQQAGEDHDSGTKPDILLLVCVS